MKVFKLTCVAVYALISNDMTKIRPPTEKKNIQGLTSDEHTFQIYGQHARKILPKNTDTITP
jgi:hypothetical protein